MTARTIGRLDERSTACPTRSLKRRRFGKRVRASCHRLFLVVVPETDLVLVPMRCGRIRPILALWPELPPTARLQRFALSGAVGSRAWS